MAKAALITGVTGQDGAYLGECLLAKVDTLLGEATQAREKLRWTPASTFADLVSDMVGKDLKAAERDDLVKRHGFAAYNHHE